MDKIAVNEVLNLNTPEGLRIKKGNCAEYVAVTLVVLKIVGDFLARVKPSFDK